MLIEEDFAYVRPTLQSLEDARGECYVLLGEIDKGLSYLQSAQKQLNQKNTRNYCRLLMQHAEAFFAADQPDQCARYTLEGLQLAASCGLIEASTITTSPDELIRSMLRNRMI
jgi:hypothetical protein